MATAMPRQIGNAAETQPFADDRYADSLEQVIANSAANEGGRNGRLALDLVSEIAKQAVVLADLGEFFSMASDLIRKAFDYQAVQIWTVSSRQEDLQLRGNSRESHFPTQPAPAAGPQWKSQDQAFRELSSDSRLPGNCAVSSSQISIPIRLRGRLLGMLLLEGAGPGAFPPHDLKILEDVSSLIALTFDKFRILSEAHRSNEYLHAILRAARDPAIIATDMQGYVITASDGAQFIFQLPHEEICGSDILSLFTESKLQRDLALHLSQRSTLPFKRTKLVRVGRPTLCLDIMLQCVFSSGDKPFGFLCVVRDITQDVLLHQSLEAQSVTDELTGLYNRRHFGVTLRGEVERSRRYGRKLSLSLLDLDGFKAVNDTQGHVRGDDVLKDAAALLQCSLRSGVDTIYRYGGDEFTIIMPETPIQDAGKACERMKERLKEHFHGDVTVSIGIADWSEPMRAEDLVVAADKAMYRAKGNGKDCIGLNKTAVGYLPP